MDFLQLKVNSRWKPFTAPHVARPVRKARLAATRVFPKATLAISRRAARAMDDSLHAPVNANPEPALRARQQRAKDLIQKPVI
jgi:hypothetical protein